MLEKYLDIKPEIKQSLAENKPVVALESTIIAHGMPYPQNVETAKRCEQIIRENGAIPATIGIINGILKVGLSAEELEIMGKSPNMMKVSRRDIPLVVAQKIHGATTVASTMIIANMAGIKVFVTGGIGGVHRGAASTFDISADLTELANTNVAVVCAGAKSILDLGLTLEYLETQGVPIIGYQTDELPAFYTRKSGLKLVQWCENIEDIASIINIKWHLNLKGGVVVANPVPEEFAMDFDYMTNCIDNALKKAEQLGIKGKETTPFLLAEIKKITQGKSLDTNIQLVFNNAKVGAMLAKSLSKFDTDLSK
ncbi:MAG: pseudouridine-5'-phosphate glycosidase [Sphingobacteriales bacterium]|nr:pseudouridine-5'-phosphate glycosidase [Sphingobacteriales bacterium]